MIVTFLIGNGFDLNLGLKTSYKDFYPFFVEKASNSNLIKNWLKEDNLLWSDMELDLGNKLKNLSVSELDEFYNSRNEMENLLCEYLQSEQEAVLINGKQEELSKEMIRSILSFHSGLSSENTSTVQRMQNKTDNNVTYQFLNFNYTDCFDKILNEAVKQNPIARIIKAGKEKQGFIKDCFHVHGLLNDGMILGVANKEQIGNEELRNNDEFVSVFTKMPMNNGLGERRVEIASGMINESSIIAIYGMSLGLTDIDWWTKVFDWLKVSNERTVVYYYHGTDNELKRKSPQTIIRITNTIRNKFVSLGMRGGSLKASELNQIKNRIMISFDNDLFQFKAIVG